MDVACVECGRVFVWSGRGRQPVTCGQRCRKRRSRRVLPAALTSRVRWCGRDGKRPVRVDGSPASSTDSLTWCEFELVRHVPHGIMLGDGLGCWDLDHVLDDSGCLINSEAVGVLAACSPLWVERSLSGRGLHVFVDAVEGAGRVSEHVSFFSRARFIAVTGDRWVSAP